MILMMMALYLNDVMINLFAGLFIMLHANYVRLPVDLPVDNILSSVLNFVEITVCARQAQMCDLWSVGYA